MESSSSSSVTVEAVSTTTVAMQPQKTKRQRRWTCHLPAEGMGGGREGSHGEPGRTMLPSRHTLRSPPPLHLKTFGVLANTVNGMRAC